MNYCYTKIITFLCIHINCPTCEGAMDHNNKTGGNRVEWSVLSPPFFCDCAKEMGTVMLTNENAFLQPIKAVEISA